MHGGHSNEVTFAFVTITLNICLFIFCRGECLSGECVKDYRPQPVQQEHQINGPEQHFDTQGDQNVL